MAAYNAHIPADAPEALPALVYDEKMVLREGGERVELRHVANAHTDGDTLVRFRHANVIAMGDVFFNHIWPTSNEAAAPTHPALTKGVDAALAMADDQLRIEALDAAHADCRTEGVRRHASP